MDSSLFYSPRKSTFINRMNQRIKLKPIFSTIKRYYTLMDAISKLNEIQETTVRFKDKQTLLIFSKEFCTRESKGSRYFMILSMEMFLRVYKAINPLTRNYYELILHSYYCKLYLDVEYLYENFKEDTKLIVGTLIKSLRAFILTELNINVEYKDFIILDSSNDVKFSLHVILVHDRVIFANNVNLGVFVKDFIEMCLLNEDKKYLFDLNENCIIDKAVYTKNRNFRIYKSTKLGQKRPLVISKFNKFPTKDKEVFLKKSLVSYFEVPIVEIQPITYKPQKEANINNKEDKPDKRAYQEPLFVTHSSFPELDKYFDSILRTKGGKIYKMRELQIKGITHIYYYPQNYRFCNRINREHKSNGIYYIVDSYTKTYWQQCFDVDCKGFKSCKIGLPKMLFQKNL
eukprot:GAHX01001047.1.p1 GENE.GAHX01001047.1~~GAHX01001047.1.p1  ORF type:complete len:401 (-),score=64.96 GAHX01001047.1:686-1888(-)